MNIMTTVNDGYSITKKSWFTQAVYGIIFSTIFGLIIMPFAFLVAIAAVLRGDLTNDNTNLALDTFNKLIDDIIAQPFFWLSIYLLSLVCIIFVTMLLGMIQLIGIKKFNNESFTLEDNIKYPFRLNNLLPFILLAFLESIVFVIIAGFLNLFRDFLDLNTTTTVSSLSDLINSFFTWQNILYLIVSIIIYLIFIPPYLISCLSIAENKAKYNAFIAGWKNYINSIVFFEGVTIISLIPAALGIIVISIVGVGITMVAGFDTTTTTTSNLTANELAIILSLSFVIVLLVFAILIFLLPFFVNSLGKSYEEQKS